MVKRLLAVLVASGVLVMAPVSSASAWITDGWKASKPSVVSNSCSGTNTTSGVVSKVCVSRNGSGPVGYMYVHNTAAGSRSVSVSGTVKVDGSTVDTYTCSTKSVASGADWYCVLGMTPSFVGNHTVTGIFTATVGASSTSQSKAAVINFG
ncbi:MAG: hypothetical protein R2731_13465 [Nocardioides sp.]